jgi:hypothetical protein
MVILRLKLLHLCLVSLCWIPEHCFLIHGMVPALNPRGFGSLYSQCQIEYSPVWDCSLSYTPMDSELLWDSWSRLSTFSSLALHT